MGNYILKRVLTFLPILLIMSLVIFFIIQLPPGDYLTSYVAGLKAEGQIVDESELASLKERYGLDQPWFMQYFKWMGNILTRFDFGYSFKYEAPVWSTIASVLPMTIVVSLVTMLFNYLVGIPIGIYSAVHQYSIGDYCFTLLGFIGMAVPNFLFAILLMYGTYIWTGTAFIDLYTSEVLVGLQQGTKAPCSGGRCWAGAISGAAWPSRSSSSARRAPAARCAPCAPRCWMSWEETTCSAPGRRACPKSASCTSTASGPR